MFEGNSMDKIKNFITSNYIEIFCVGLLFIILLSIGAVFWNYCGDFIVDCGREAYFPQQVLEGKILYKDIFNIYGPLSYQLNALFYKIVGLNINTLRLVGLLNALLILPLIYVITRFFTSKEVCWAVSFFILATCFFGKPAFNYIFPYAYAMEYALSFCLLSILFLLIYFKTSKQFLIPLSCFFIGASVASKYDFLPYLIFLAFVIFVMKFYNKLKTKYLFYSLIALVFVPFVCFLTLHLQGLTVKEFLNQLVFIKIYSLSDSIQFLFTNMTGLYPSLNSFQLDFRYFIKSLTLFILFVGLIYFSLKHCTTRLKAFSAGIIYLFVFGFCCYDIFMSKWILVFVEFCWLPLFTVFVFVLMLVRLFKTKNYSKDGSYTILVLLSLIASMKSLFFLNLNSYGTFNFPLLFIVNTIFIVEYLPLWFKNLDKTLVRKSFSIFVIGLGTLVFVNVIYNYFFVTQFSVNASGQQEARVLRNQSFGSIVNKRGTFFADKNIAASAQQAIDYIEKNLRPDDTLWVVPEGPMINFLTNHSFPTIYYNSTSPFLETFGEEKIISDIEKTPPDYIIINDKQSVEYGYTFFGKDYGFNLYSYILAAYDKVAVFGKAYKFVIYKKSAHPRAVPKFVDKKATRGWSYILYK